jgi:hypothetical protein
VEQPAAHRCAATPNTTEHADAIRHDWTVSRRTLVLSGPRRRLLEVARQIGAPIDQVIDVSSSRSVLALDEDLLVAYQVIMPDDSGQFR